MSNPLYAVGDVVYLRSSAALGFIEAVKISNVMSSAVGTWLYSIRYSTRNPGHAAAMGDRISLVHNQTVFYTEDEFVPHCTALEMAETNLEAQLNKLRAQRIAICGSDGTE